MAHTYLLFDFGSDEKKVQQARHKLDQWRQTFRLDKKLQFKFERDENAVADSADASESPASEKSKPPNAKSKSKSGSKAKSSEPAAENNGGDVRLFVRLYFSGHEKLSEQRWIERIPAEDPFKSASPKVIRESEPEFADILKHFDTLE